MKSTFISSVRFLLPATALFVTVTACENSGQKTAYPAYDSGSSSSIVTTYDTSTSMNDVNYDTSSMNNANSATAMEPAPATGTAAKTVKKKTRTTVGTMPAANASVKMQADKSGVYDYSEVRPAYIGGQSALEDYINSRVEYPQQAMDNNTQGTVNVQFTVDENGRISNAHVLGEGLSDGLDQEAVRVVNSLPKWQAGTVRGKTVKSKVTLPITFRIEE